MGKCLFDLLFDPNVDSAQLAKFRQSLGEKICAEHTTRGDDHRWTYVKNCIQADFSNTAIAMQILIILHACFVHESMRETIEKQYGEKDVFLTQYFEYLDYVMSDFCSSDPIESEKNWPIPVTLLRHAWLERDLQRPWNTLSIRAPKKRLPKGAQPDHVPIPRGPRKKKVAE